MSAVDSLAVVGAVLSWSRDSGAELDSDERISK